MKKGKLFIFVLVCLILVYIGRNVIKGIKSGAGSLEERLPSTYQILKDDSLVISDIYLKKLRVLEVINMTTRKPISNYKVSDSFNISIFRATVTTTKTISSIISVSNSGTVSEPGVSYLSVHYSPFSKIKFLGGVPKPIDNIILGVNGEIIEKSTKDDFFHIRTYCKWVSAKYLTKADNDIELVGDDIPFASTVPIPLELMIIKRNDIVYFIFITPIDPKKDVPNFGIDFLR